MKHHIYITLTLEFIEETDGVWLARCEELGTSTFGDSFEEVKKEINELVHLQLNTLEKLGERENFFKDNGIVVYETTPPVDKEVRTPLKRNVFVNSYAQELVCT